jgi:hypothetical protein
MKTPDGTILAEDVTPIEQLEYVKKVQELWADNSVSCTVYYDKKWLPKIYKWLKANMKDIKTVSMLPFTHEFLQAPYQKISEEEYNKAMETLIPFDGTDLFNDSEVLLAENTECAGGSCSLR